MQNWMKYLLQSAVTTGGLLMLGTGIASASENFNPDLPASPLDQIVAPAASGLSEAVKQARPLQQLDAADEDSLQPSVDAVVHDVPAAVPPTSTPVGPVYPVPAGLLDFLPLRLDEIVSEAQEPNLNGPLGAELGAAELPALPILTRVEQAPASLPVRKPTLPVQSEFAILPAPVDTTVATDPLDAGSGTRVTAVHVAAPRSATERRTPGSTLPLVGGLLPAGESILPTKMATNGRLPVLGEIAALPQNAPLLGTGTPSPALEDNGVLELTAVQQVAGSVGNLLRK
ncbi:hypothetical protein P3102_07115 [Amycolatopsis sp. QT-25]|uniref:hypothetical protein n=1 Tax=Amycolatopsis sp. QT-25 TaxID=3034022 RepID=UPI0023EA8D1B|nr:hypothetical protein [Amycolatopsis sp. QT-25]WET80998.1 hypothetical protein P3102_07115 [Amycolatopsis sp. QT-25]